MNKKYTQPIEQYNLEGVKVSSYINASETSKKISNYDSIIRCCLGKYKTSEGFIFRFEGEPFELKINKFSKSKPHTCKICGSKENIKSMAMHLRHVHNSNTTRYIKEYGEFRPKYLTQIKLKDKSKIKCQECGKRLNSNQHLMYHISTQHPEFTKSEYIIKNMFDNVPPLCACGCGEEVTLLENGRNCDLGKDKYNRDYVKGHWDWEVFSNINHQSKEELELLEYIKTQYKGEIQESVRGLIKKCEVDIFLPQLKLAIEYNGLYWHSEKCGRLKDYHIDKTQKCKEKDIRLIHIFSDEWLNKKEIVKSKLSSILGINNEKIFARKCQIFHITPKEKNEFLNKYHIQGEDRSKIKLGIFYQKELVGVMTFSNPRLCLGAKAKNQDVYELSRFSTSLQIIGGASKMLSYFKKEYSPKEIYSYSDNRWTDPEDNMYLKIGFTHNRTSTPGYSYTKDYLIRHHRYNFNKFKLKNMGCDVKNYTEKEIMEGLGYTRVWDCGSTKYSIFF